MHLIKLDRKTNKCNLKMNESCEKVCKLACIHYILACLNWHASKKGAGMKNLIFKKPKYERWTTTNPIVSCTFINKFRLKINVYSKKHLLQLWSTQIRIYVCCYFSKSLERSAFYVSIFSTFLLQSARSKKENRSWELITRDSIIRLCITLRHFCRWMGQRSLTNNYPELQICAFWFRRTFEYSGWKLTFLLNLTSPYNRTA